MMYSAILLVASLISASAFGPASLIRFRASKMNLKAALANPEPEYVLEVSNGAKAIVRTYGCNAFSYTTADGIEVMGTRKDAKRGDDSKPYPGGAPHCFPQFGPGALVQHGFARGMKFIPEERSKELSFDRIVFKLVPTEDTKKVWDYDFEYKVDITLRSDSLEWDVEVFNKGGKPFDITTGLHTYWDVSSLSNVKIEGPFKGAETLCKVSGTTSKAESDSLSITAPIDMVFKGVTGPVSIIDSGKGTKTTISSKGYPDTVLWSPYGNENMGFDKFICIEPVQTSPLTIPVSQASSLVAKFNQKVQCVKL